MDRNPTNGDDLLTLGQISSETGEPDYRVKYAVTRYRIVPDRRIGIVRVWRRSQLPAIKNALARTAESRRDIL